MREEEKRRIREEILNTNIEHLKKQGKDDSDTESFKNNLGNIILLKKAELENKSIFNKD